VLRSITRVPKLVKQVITILFLFLFVSALSLDVYANYKKVQVSSYELMETEEDQDSEEDDGKEEVKKDEFINHQTQPRFFSELSVKEFSDRQYLWKLEVFEIILPPPELA